MGTATATKPTTAPKSVWDEFEDTEDEMKPVRSWFSFDSVGKSIKGVFVGYYANKNYDPSAPQGQQGIPGQFGLVTRDEGFTGFNYVAGLEDLKYVQPGKYVKITFKGTEKSKGGFNVKQFDLLVHGNDAIELSTLGLNIKALEGYSEEDVKALPAGDYDYSGDDGEIPSADGDPNWSA